MNAFSLLERLSENDKNFLITKKIESEKSADEWLNFFNNLRHFDKYGDKTRQRSFGIGCAGAILLALSLIVSPFLFAMFIEDFIPVVTILFTIFFLALVITLIIATTIGFRRFKKLKQYDIDSEMLSEKVLPLLLILGEEMKQSDKIKMRLDLRGFETQDKLINQSKNYGSGAYRSIIDFYYRDSWIDGKATLGDGTQINWQIQDLVKHIKKVKYRKGKRKSKSKHRTLLNFQIGMPQKKHRLPARLKIKGTEGKLRTKKAGAYHWISIKKTIKHPLGQKFTPNDFVNAIASAYIRATPFRRNK